MAVSYGFFDSQNGDRKYNAQQMTEFYDGIVTNGVFQHVSNGLAVSAGTGLNVSVAAGRAIIQKHWVKNDAALAIAVPAASATYARIDAVVIRYSSANRNIAITVKEGTAAASPVAPSMTRDGSTYEMAIAYVNVPANASSVTVIDKRSDSSVCGWAAVAQATSGEVDQMLNAMKTGFDGVVYSSPAAMVQGEDTKINARITDMKTFYPEYIRNGSWGNAGNVNVVTMGMFPIEKGMEYVSFETDRPLDDPSYFYTLGFTFFNDRAVGDLTYKTGGIAWQVDCDTAGTYKPGTKIPVPSTAKMMLFMVTQSDGTNFHALRQDDFMNYRVRMMPFYKITEREPFAYISNSGTFQFTDQVIVSGKIPFRTSGDIVLTVPGFNQISASIDTIIGQLTSDDIYTSGSTSYIAIRANRTLVYDFDQSKFVTVENQPTTKLSTSQYPILLARSNMMSGGLLYVKFMYDLRSLYLSRKQIFQTGDIRNGTYNNSANADAVCVGMFAIEEGTEYISLETDRPVTSGYYYSLGYVLSSKPISNTTYTTEGLIANVSADAAGTYRMGTKIPVPKNAKSALFVIIEIDGTNLHSIRMHDFYDYHLRMVSYFGEGSSEGNIVKKVNNARHIPGNAATPLTLLHLSDIHADASAQSRIIDSINLFESKIDDMICTGDMVAGTGEAISSWWNPNIMTCIGNHDCATWSQETGYDWTAVSMAQRDAWYIAPFESGWGITHTSGTSYYYKDYATQKVRLIVIDDMLYSDNGSEATAQTSWLEGLLASAITSDLHVLIALHAVHGGATPIPSTFTKVGQGTMPTYTDCNTPQVVIDAVASAISSGLKFIGYICGHTHQDNIWDAESNGSQLMYCITCAAVTQTAQWIGADMYRDQKSDAYNIVTIDTANTLVKLIRGGGADVDDHMRPRKMICIDYSTGEIVGEEK